MMPVKLHKDYFIHLVNYYPRYPLSAIITLDSLYDIVISETFTDPRKFLDISEHMEGEFSLVEIQKDPRETMSVQDFRELIGRVLEAAPEELILYLEHPCRLIRDTARELLKDV